MKLKPIYVYLSAFVVFIVAIVIFSNYSSESKGTAAVSENAQMPQDDMHKGMGSGEMGAPSKSNVMEEAIKKLNELKAAYQKNPSDTMKMREYADMASFAHKTEEAQKIYEKLLNMDPKRIDILLQLTFVEFTNKNFDKALDYTNRIIKLDKNNLPAVYNSAAIYNEMGDKKKAVSIWNDLAKKYPKTEIGHMAEQSAAQVGNVK